MQEVRDNAAEVIRVAAQMVGVRFDVEGDDAVRIGHALHRFAQEAPQFNELGPHRKCLVVDAGNHEEVLDE